MTLEEQLAKVVELGWFPSLRLVGESWVAAAGKRGSGAYVTGSGETPGEAMAALIERIERWTA